MTDEIETKPTFEDVLEHHLERTTDPIWLGNSLQSEELRRTVANEIGTLVRDAYRAWHRKLDQDSSLDKNAKNKLQPANPLEGVDLSPNPDPRLMDEQTSLSTLVQHGPVVDLDGNVVKPEMRTVSQADLDALANPLPETHGFPAEVSAPVIIPDHPGMAAETTPSVESTEGEGNATKSTDTGGTPPGSSDSKS